ncbi:MAG: AAA family ATPase [Nautiliaceae bacterium]
MRLYLNNIGMIKEADVKLDGLTVIVGENDTGKSTVGKVIFSILKGIQKYEENLEDKFKRQLFKIIDDFYKNYQKIIKNEKINILFFPPFFVKDVLTNKTNLSEFFDKYKNLIKDLNNKELEKDFESLTKKIKIILLDNDEKELQEEALKRAFFSEFRNQLKLNNSDKGIIELYDDDKKVIEIEITDEIRLKGNFEVFLDDVTLIETPMILNFSDMIQSARSHFEEDDLNRSLIRLEADVIYHSKDLVNKLVRAAKYGDNEIDKDLLKILKFDFEYKDKTREFVYLKNRKEYFSINVADGIKSFGIIKLLLKGNFIRKNILLIIDEPEVHLHPKWQIEYAKLIVELVKKGIKVLITSHSPFFIDAIDKLSYKIDVNYYFAENGFIKEDNNLELMYKKLNIVISDLEDLEIEEMVFKANKK